MAKLCTLSLIGTLLASLPSACNAATLTRIAVGDGAVCLDGSPYSYYVSVGSNATRFFIYYQG